MSDIESIKLEFVMHSVVSVMLDAIKRNGLEKTLEDLNRHCRIRPVSDEGVYASLLKCINNISERRERIPENKQQKKGG